MTIVYDNFNGHIMEGKIIFMNINFYMPKLEITLSLMYPTFAINNLRGCL